jgi:hypothetical protein
MMTRENSVSEATPTATARLCIFCQVDDQAPSRSRPPHRAQASHAPRCTCLLNPGRPLGPDGQEIDVAQCTMERQTACQARRKHEFARLCANVPALRKIATKSGGNYGAVRPGFVAFARR